jgi:hypothetical protein
MFSMERDFHCGFAGIHVNSAAKGCVLTALAIFPWWGKAFPGQEKVESRLNRSRDSGRKYFGEPTEKMGLAVTFFASFFCGRKERRTVNAILKCFWCNKYGDINHQIITMFYKYKVYIKLFINRLCFLRNFSNLNNTFKKQNTYFIL